MADLLNNGRHMTMGRYNEEFEAAFAARHGARHAVAVSSGTAALEILLRAIPVASRRVVVPTNTFGATPVSVIRAGGIPVFADCGPDMAVDPDAVEALLSPEVVAVVIVHIGGRLSQNLPRLSALCQRAGIALVEDAAHASGASLAGHEAGTWGLGGAFSFFSTKVMTTGEGGMLVTGDERVRDFARRLRDHAKEANGTMNAIGYNWRLTEMQAILGLVQLRGLEDSIRRRATVAAAYRGAVAGLPGVGVIEDGGGSAGNHYKEIIFVGERSPTELRRALQDRFEVTLGGEVYAVPCHLQAAFASYPGGPFPNADRLCGRHICPPILPDMTGDELEWATQALRQELAEATEGPLGQSSG